MSRVKLFTAATAAGLSLFDIAAATAQVPLPVWTGGYVGGEIGGRSDEGRAFGALPPICSGPTCAASNFRSGSGQGTAGGGPYVGYNFQIGPTFVVGFEGSSDLGSTSRTTRFSSNATVTNTVTTPPVIVPLPPIFNLLATDAVVAPPCVFFDGICIPTGGGVTPGTTTTTSSTFAGSGAVKVTRGVQGTLATRFGYLVLPTVLVYGLGGLSLLDEHVSAFTTGAFGTGSWSKSMTRVGYTIGAGIETAVTPLIHLRLQYAFSDYGTEHYRSAITPTDVRVDTEIQRVTVGASYNF